MSDALCHPEAQLGDFIEAYEAAQVREGKADPADFLPDPSHSLYRAVLRELVRVDLEYGWQRGQPCSLETYQQRFPALRDDPEGLQEIAFEDERLRKQAAEEAAVEQAGQTLVVPGPAAAPELAVIAQAYQEFCRHNRPGEGDVDAWCASLRNAEPAAVFRDVHRSDPAAASRLAEAVTCMPEVGECFLGFRLIEELGRGAFGRVFLAHQGELANRPVALKVSSDFGESQTLAQLQHTNIVPIYSVHQAPPFQAVCMPYFGAVTLADVLRDLASRGSLPASGKDLISTLVGRQRSTVRHADSGSHWRKGSVRTGSAPAEPSGELATAPGPGRTTLEMLERFSYVHSILWMMARLADGLTHAHERGILHRDLKPANILLTDDGQPMLLDFNLSEDTKARSSAAAAIGGTLLYMAPEHLDAFEGGKGRVDERSDLYALGLIGFQLLAGRHPFPQHRGALPERLARLRQDRLGPPPELRRWNQSVSPAVEAILRRCLEPDPARRYQSASQLREDLERQLKDLPLHFAAEPSLRERVGKWTRRHPRLTSSTTVGAVAGVLLVALGTWFGVWAYTASQQTAARQAQEAAQTTLSQFEDEVRTARRLLTTPDLTRAKQDEGTAAARSALARYQIGDNPHWDDLPLVRCLDDGQRAQVREDGGELLLLLSGTASREAADRLNPPSRQEGLRTALRLSELAEACYGADEAPPTLWSARAEVLRLLQRSDEAENLAKKAQSHPPQRVRELYLFAAERALQGRYREAIPLLRDATRREPSNYWAWWILGICHDHLGQQAEALACHSACIALVPDDPWAYFNRGLVRVAQRDFVQGHADFTQAIRLRGDVWDFHLNQAQAAFDLKHYPEANAGYTRALLLAGPNTRIYFLRAQARHRLGDHDGAARDEVEGLTREPRDEQSWIARGLFRVNVKNDRRGAVADYKKALELNPRFVGAWQNIANALADEKDGLQEAIEAETQALTLDPNYAFAWSGRGTLLARQGKRAAAHADAEEALRLDNEPATLYQVAGIFAQTSRQHPEDRARALELLSLALRRGFGHDLLKDDSDLDPIRNLPEFRRLEQAAQALLPRRASPPQ